MKPTFHSSLLLSLVFAFITTPALADLLLDDSFSYSSGTALASQGGWTNPNPQTGDIYLSPGSLSMDGFASSSGNSLSLRNSSPYASTEVQHSFSAQSSDTYLSFMINVFSTNSSGYEIAGLNESKGAEVGGIWLRTDQSDPDSFDIGGSVDGSTPVQWNNGQFQFGMTYLIQEQIQFPRPDNSADVSNVWITPDGGNQDWGGISGGPSAIQTSDPSDPIHNLNGLTFNEGNGSSPTLTIDELRVGQTWADITPVEAPEPKSLSLLALAGLLLGGRFLAYRRKTFQLGSSAR